MLLCCYPKTEMKMKLVFFSAAALLLSTGASFAQYQGVAAADGSNYVAVSYASNEAVAESLAREDCYQSTNGMACKAISAGTENNFVVVRCGKFVHMAAEASVPEARQTAIANARNFGHRGCRTIFSN
jgi:hypothetical protein